MSDKDADSETGKTMSSENHKMSLKPANEIRICGIEGGGTHSSLIVMDGKGNQLIHAKGPDTNHWAIGMEETAVRLNRMMNEAKESLGIPASQSFDCTGLCLSGGEEEETNNKLLETLITNFPNASKEYMISSDTIGSLKTGSDTGGIVLIAGTGSNGLLINPDGVTHGCGGWGHMMGDEGSAYWIAHKACKYVFDDMDGLIKAPHSISYVWPAIRTHFHVPNRHAMLRHIYSNFDKSKFAMITKELAKGCENKDPLCLSLFASAGQMLAKHVNALASKAHNDVKLGKGGLKVICVGSVWKSWDHMKNGFINEIQETKIIDELTLYKLTASSAIGACYAAGEKIECDSLVKTHDKNVEAFYHYKRENVPIIESPSASLDNCCETTTVSVS